MNKAGDDSWDMEKTVHGSWQMDHGKTSEADSDNHAEAPVNPVKNTEMEKQVRLERQLSILKSRQVVLQRQSALLKNMLDNCDEQTNEKERLWLQMLYHGVHAKLSKFDESKQLPLEAKIMVMRLAREFKRKAG